ncbi:MAG: hypothetical protein KAW88_01435 [Candidatus Cloacimonetes bacterium]|nr:hypothetical protein [Candidatus Cloacimonadota bacterium]
MSHIIEFKVKDIQPEKDIVFKEFGIPKNNSVSEKIQQLYSEAIKVFRETSKPIVIYFEISKEEFEKVFFGEGNNSTETPVEQIFPKADNLILFALTMGKEVSEKIETLFKENDFALGSMLDCIASLAADKAVKKLETFNTENHRMHRKKVLTLAYSPGYCGWDISGQKKLFEYLQPEKIGITLNDSFLMIPLKSVSGILIAGEKSVHKFKNDFPFCSKCETKSCRERLKNLANGLLPFIRGD